MNVCLVKYKSRSSDSINDVVENSLIDLGHKLVKHSKADILIAVRDFSSVKERYRDKKYILFQIEQYEFKSGLVDKFYEFKPDEVWGFDITNKKELYTPLGYHPCLGFKSRLPVDIDVGFIGWQRGRRDVWRSKVKKKWNVLNTFNDKIRGENVSRTRINLNVHFYGDSSFTEWGRVAYFLANEQFFISEEFYCPIEVLQFKSVAQYDFLVAYFLKHVVERKERAREMSKVYKRDFDMRDILKERL